MANSLASLRDRFGTGRLGLAVISLGVRTVAPYFGTVRPWFTRFDPGHVVATMRKRRGVTNHLGTVHAIAMCNMAELVGGTCTDLLVPSHLRWIPVGMEVAYLKMAKTDLTATCRVDDTAPFETPGDVVTPVEVHDTAGQLVFTAKIRMRVSERRTT